MCQQPDKNWSDFSPFASKAHFAWKTELNEYLQWVIKYKLKYKYAVRVLFWVETFLRVTMAVKIYPCLRGVDLYQRSLSEGHILGSW